MMGKIALLVSREEMLYQAHNILQEKKYDIGEMRVIKTEDAVSEARQSIAGGASIIIARGLQASLIKQYTDIPVADIILTAQEMALLVIRAKQILKKQMPVIGVVGFENMFCDMSYFDTIYDIELRTYFARRGSELEDAARSAVADGVDLIIGGDTAVSIAGGAGVPSLFLSITEDSMRNAFAMAERMNYAMGAEKRNAAQMETLLDYSFSGIIRMNGEGIVTDINPIMEDLLGRKKETVQGLKAGEVCRELDQESLRQVLQDGLESYSFFMQMNRSSIFAIVAPVMIEGRVDGAILTCHRMKKRPTAAEESRQRRHSKGFIALGQFEDILRKSKAMQDCLHLAKLCALSEKPVYIHGEAGTEKRLLAQSIHNAGVRRSRPFVDISCDGIGDAEQLEMIFGEKGAVVQSDGGTVLIEDLGSMTKANQYRLYQLIRYRLRVIKGVNQYPNTDTRIMISERRPLAALLQSGRLREELYYLLQGLTIRIPPLRERQEDLEQKLEDSIRDCCDHYSRHHVLTAGAKKLLLEFSWEGNLFQVENFCERLILTAGKRSLDEAHVRKLLENFHPVQAAGSGINPSDPVNPHAGDLPYTAGAIVTEEAERIRETLQHYSGNRGKTAKALGISKTTLWRKMKRYHIN